MSKMPCIFDTLYLFCGRRADRIKGLVWEGDGWLLLYKGLSGSRFQWPRSPDEVRLPARQQFRWLMEGLTTTPKKPARPVEPPEYMGWFCAEQGIFQAVSPLQKLPCPGSMHPGIRARDGVPRGCASPGLIKKHPQKAFLQKPYPQPETWAL